MSVGTAILNLLPVALIGPTGLLLLYLWLGSAIAASWISARKGYGERPGLAAGLLLAPIGVALWLLWPAKPGSRWRTGRAVGRPRR
ncbi:MAG: hypothetical protein ACRDZ9_01860 [Acidimicrobiales bacterium]